MEVAQARQQVAQAEFDLTQATGHERSTYSVLLGAMGISPTTAIKVQDLAGCAGLACADEGQRTGHCRSTGRVPASEQDFVRLQSVAAQEIVVAYDVLRTSLSANAAAAELVNAAQTNYEAALDYYKNGLGTLADVSIAQTGLLKAQYGQAQVRSDAFVAVATLAFATGSLTSANSL